MTLQQCPRMVGRILTSYADNLSKELPRIPVVKTFAGFLAFSTASRKLGDAAYPLKLFQRVITVSLETMKIVRALPRLDIAVPMEAKS